MHQHILIATKQSELSIYMIKGWSIIVIIENSQFKLWSHLNLLIYNLVEIILLTLQKNIRESILCFLLLFSHQHCSIFSWLKIACNQIRLCFWSQGWKRSIEQEAIFLPRSKLNVWPFRCSMKPSQFVNVFYAIEPSEDKAAFSHYHRMIRK